MTGARGISLNYDWLGSGVYFWQENPLRALQWARELKEMKPDRVPPYDPDVIGAVIDLGYCLDLISANGIDVVKAAYLNLRSIYDKAGKLAALPKNRRSTRRESHELVLRYLDCAVINYLHSSTKENSFDTVRGIFIEGEPIYPNSGLHEKSHIQICVKNHDCIKAVFRVHPRHLNQHQP